MKDFIEFINLKKRFNGFEAVSDISFSIKSGEIFALLGPNGAGKTTTIRMLTGLLKPTSGHIRINGEDVSNHPELVRGKFGVLPQDNAGYAHLTVKENIIFFASLAGYKGKEFEDMMYNYLEELDLSDFSDKKFGKLSGGEKRAVCLVRAITGHYKVIILDEPTSGLDIARAAKTREIIERLAKQGKTIIMSSHITTDLEQLADRCGILKKGELIFQGNKDELIASFSKKGTFEDAVIQAFRINVNGSNKNDLQK
jgi:ABC-type multidrug transport system ATPase subunit